MKFKLLNKAELARETGQMAYKFYLLILGHINIQDCRG